jgi:hypothetical protein
MGEEKGIRLDLQIIKGGPFPLPFPARTVPCMLPMVSDAPSISMAADQGEFPSPAAAHDYPISTIKIGQRHRQELGNIDELARSIAEVGLLHRVVITPDGTLIAGQRRLAACRKLGWQNIPVHVLDMAEIARGEFAENAFRKTFLPTEVHAIWQALEPIERAAAQERQKATRFGSGGGKLPQPSKGKTRDKVAKLAGVSGRTMDKIAEVMQAAEANARYEPLVKMMDQTESVHGAYNELKAMKAADAEPVTTGAQRRKASIQLSAAAYNAAFPQYTPLSEHNSVVFGLWLCGTSWHKGRLHGQYPPTFLQRALALFPGVKDIFHCPSGTVLGPGLTIDRFHDDVRCPQIVADAAELPLPSDSMDVGLSDPPYTNTDSKIYGCEPFPLRKFMQEARRALRPGGYLGILHTIYPRYRKDEWKVAAMIGVATAPGRAARFFTIFQRL